MSHHNSGNSYHNYYTSSSTSNLPSQYGGEGLPRLRDVLPEHFPPRGHDQASNRRAGYSMEDPYYSNAGFNGVSSQSTRHPHQTSSRDTGRGRGGHSQRSLEKVLEMTPQGELREKRESRPANTPKRYKCPKCDLAFDRPTALETHDRTHTGVQRESPMVYNISKIASVLNFIYKHLCVLIQGAGKRSLRSPMRLATSTHIPLGAHSSLETSSAMVQALHPSTTRLPQEDEDYPHSFDI
ncbi:hypothetical protein BU17DRAFT_103873 [Hysterangium stoloniferum]|nr:hypothetical protein BU17DRAFT_103873 [Hysterangium stoloniferum]